MLNKLLTAAREKPAVAAFLGFVALVVLGGLVLLVRTVV